MLYVSKSTLPGAGKGLFTDKPIKKGTRIIEYTGDIITYKEYDERVQNDRYGYLFYINKNRCIDAYDHKEALARYANDAKGIGQLKAVSNNSKYVVVGNRCYIVAYRNIPAGGEILVGYGAEYWRDLKYNKALDKKKSRSKKKCSK
ncbi:MAG: SET domain-containing protein [Bacteroidia bacterium]|nr:SET domain-containing protein [Bacteroidia bacterium]MCZ2278082.1 SET domain-containing protein [Bacteroidia bacterium]